MMSKTKVSGVFPAAPIAAVALALTAAAPRLQAAQQVYRAHNLVSDGAVAADHMDANLKNAWGVAFNPMGFVWVADNHTGKSTLYDGMGNPQMLVVSIPGTGGNPGAPTGIVFSGSMTDFMVTGPAGSGPARFIFVGEDGILSAWSPMADGTHAIQQADNSPTDTIYKGLALAANGTGEFLYATDFHNNKIDVFDSAFHPATLSGNFSDPTIPAGFAPFGIQAIGGVLYVTYAMQDEDGEDDVAGAGLGYVNVFDANGFRIRRLISQGKLNAPWGIALAPGNFGKFSNDLLVGNFGDGTINAYNISNGTFRGKLRSDHGEPIKIDGLWGIQFGNGLNNQPTNTLFFAAGPNVEENGLYGRIDLVEVEHGPAGQGARDDVGRGQK